MAIAQSLLPEYDQEMATTRRMLERVPMEKASWKPHDKSMPIGRLASHLAELPQWAVNACTADELDFMAGGKPSVPVIFDSRQTLLAKFDEHAKLGRDAIAATSDATFMEQWTLKANGEAIFSMPKVAVVRSMVMNHMIHHRGQLSVFLRLLDVPVPRTYGPSADEN
ncbi:MAG: DinB family protein [Gemmatimonadota bacterium]|nr:DinB family protein [Gemmatimonadota bacterium]